MHTENAPWYETAFAAHYPLLYQHRDEAEARHCVDLLPRLAPLGEGTILDLGCGGGRHLELIAARGGRAVGLDLSADLLRLAAERGRETRADFALLRGDMRVLPFLSASLTSVLSLFTAFGYFGGLADNASVVAEVARILRPGGHWFLDYFNAELVASELAAELAAEELAAEAGGDRDSGWRQRELGPLQVTERRRLLSDPARVGKTVQLRPLPDQLAAAAAWGVPPEGLAYQEEVALFTLAELDALLAEHGLARVATAGDYDGQPLDSERSPRWLLVYRKTTAAHGGGKS